MSKRDTQRAVAEAFDRMSSDRNPPFASREMYLADCLDVHRTYIDGQSPEDQIRMWIEMLEDPVAAGYREAFATEDMTLFAAAIQHSVALAHAKLLPGGSDHSQLYGLALTALAVHDVDRVDLLLPESLPPAAHGHPVAIAATNLIMAIRAGEESLGDRARRDTTAALNGSLTDADRALLAALTAILDRDPHALFDQLQRYARAMSRRKTATSTPLQAAVSPSVHGVFALAIHSYTTIPGGSDQLVRPTSGAFSADFADWQIEGVRAGAFLAYEPPLELIAVILNTLPPSSRLRLSARAGASLLDAEGFRADLMQAVLVQLDSGSS